MKHFLWVFLLSTFHLGAQPKFELQEFTGAVKSIEPGFRFALEKICLEVNGVKDCFIFPPDYGKFLTDRVQINDVVTVRAQVNIKARESRKNWANKLSDIPWFLFRDVVQEIKIKDEWIKLPPVKEDKQKVKAELFLHVPILMEYREDGFKKGVLIPNGIFLFNQVIGNYYDPLKEYKVGDRVSFIGPQVGPNEGYVYIWPEVKSVYHMATLRNERVEIQSLLFKQNHTCIGAKFKTTSGNEVSVSFPSYRAEEIKSFLKPNVVQEIFFGRDYETGKYNLPELHAIIQGSDTLKIEELGFYGGADGKHEHKDVGVVGKITHLDRTPKGNVASIVVNSEYYMEIDAMMAQQIGYIFKKGLMISVIGKERIKIPGELYKKNYKIVVPEKVVVDGKTFSLYQP